MNRMTICVFFVIICSCKINTLLAQTSQFETEPFWEENFDNDGFPNKKEWSLEQRVCGTREAIYTGQRKENVYVEDGVLNLTLRKEVYKGYSRTTAHMKSIRGFRTGKFELRAKLPVGRGVWPAIWLRSMKNGDYFGEIDIVEFNGSWNGTRYQTNIHVVENLGGARNRIQKGKMVSANISEYQVYGIEWYEDKIVVFLNGQVVHELRKENVAHWPFNLNDYRFTISLDCGGWAGYIDDSNLPKTLKVDWIKYYRLKEKAQ